jgi:hypothetical protein
MNITVNVILMSFCRFKLLVFMILSMSNPVLKLGPWPKSVVTKVPETSYESLVSHPLSP